MPDCLILTHGAGSNRDAPLLVAVDHALTSAGVEVRRINLPYREARASGSPRPADAERDREGLAAAVNKASSECGGRVFLGGHSYGGRQSSMLVADQPELVSGLLLMSYPLHPPGQPQKLRTAHLPQIKPPVLFVHGTRDPFGSLEEMGAAIALIPAPTSLLVMEKAGHELARGPAAVTKAANLIAERFATVFKLR